MTSRAELEEARRRAGRDVGVNKVISVDEIAARLEGGRAYEVAWEVARLEHLIFCIALEAQSAKRTARLTAFAAVVGVGVALFKLWTS